ncbi:methyltransferase [Rhodoferax sp.]|uniref:methyltransferase n=1 Tax=Rhodoferax sp. TaxID=50421 RepID=UPI00374D1CEA
MSTTVSPLSQTLHWTEADQPQQAHWRSERGAPPPKRVVLADDTTSADTAYRLACEGTALLWRGDFHNARQLLQALARRIDKTPARKQRKAPKEAGSLADAFHLHRQAQAQRARVLNMLLLPINADYSIPLRRAPNVHAACLAAWGPADAAAGNSVITLRELQGVTSTHEWRRKGIEIPALGEPPQNRIHPHYGVYSPVRGEYIDLVAKAPLPPAGIAFDIGTGTGVLAAVLARRGVAQVVATDMDPRALACARDNLAQLGVAQQVQLLQADLFPEGQATLIVCNPPWVPARPGSPIEHAVYDEDGRMLLGFLAGLKSYLAPGGEGWLILSDFAEHLGLRTRAELLEAFERNGLKVLDRLDAKPVHPKATDATAALHAARAAEVTSLWRLAVA